MQPPDKLKNTLEKIYRRYNKKTYIHPDPLEFIYKYKNKRDREIVGLIASSLAYGKVAQILKSVSIVLDRMGNSPYKYLETQTSYAQIERDYKGFRHRFATGEHLSALLWGIRSVNATYGSLNNCFWKGFNHPDGSMISAINFFTSQLETKGRETAHLVACPAKGSACKRLHLYFRWMVRKDAVDPGTWNKVPASELIIPLDTHMHRIGILLGFTKRKQANMKTALEITEKFRELAPGDPVKYDFALTRFGIRDDMKIEDLFK